jgi:hypothetical protein
MCFDSYHISYRNSLIQRSIRLHSLALLGRYVSIYDKIRGWRDNPSYWEWKGRGTMPKPFITKLGKSTRGCPRLSGVEQRVYIADCVAVPQNQNSYQQSSRICSIFIFHFMPSVCFCPQPRWTIIIGWFYDHLVHLLMASDIWNYYILS